MKRTLLVAGSLSDRAVRRHLRSADAGGTTVVEMDTLHDRAQFPAVAHWQDYGSLFPLEQAARINAAADDVIDYFLTLPGPSAQVPTHRAFRAACLPVQAWRVTVPCLVNLHIAQQMLREQTYDRLIVSAGCGIHFGAWREISRRHNLPLTLLPMEPASPGLARWLRKKWHRLRKPAPLRLEPPSAHSDASSARDSILCISERASRLLAAAPDSRQLPLLPLTVAQVNACDSSEVAQYSLLYQQWWTAWQQERSTSSHPLASAPGSQAIFEAIGAEAVRHYPRYASIYQRALRELERLQPRLLLCDTQTGSAERMWSLAAQELGIPVVAYVYDHVPNPRFSFTPDLLLSNSGRITQLSLERGVPEKAIIPTQSHRQVRPGSSAAAPSSARPLILYADSYYAGLIAHSDPSSSYRCYRLVVETARRLPNMDFAIKFHPLREKKQEMFSFVALDETELRNRKNYIHSLQPPANLRFIEPEVSMMDDLQKSSVLLNLNSTAALEAFQLGIPVIFLEQVTPLVKAFLRIHDYAACISAETPETLQKELLTLTSDPDACIRQFLKQKLYLEEFYWPAAPSLTESLKTCLTRLS
ncbi:hypothetical protein WJU23_19240 [Prosthecobacter sp. SYSU 5D2]|uniref:hypothetical protein n=1 Tax=Prosthecobacter sp. SYSU 5D2 TaxID=3134134 RepID=UPI0031FED75C